MTKQAAEQIAQEYYTFGQELAIANFAKTAGLPKDVGKKILNAASKATGGLLGGVVGASQAIMPYFPTIHGSSIRPINRDIAGLINNQYNHLQLNAETIQGLVALLAGGAGMVLGAKYAPQLKIRKP